MTPLAVLIQKLLANGLLSKTSEGELRCLACQQIDGHRGDCVVLKRIKQVGA